MTEHRCDYPYHCDRCLMEALSFWHVNPDDPSQDKDTPDDW